MKKLLTLTVSVALLLVVSSPMAYSQGAGAPPAQAPAQAAEKVFEGQLTKVDATAKSISVKGTGAEAPEMIFAYTEQTQMSGADQTIQGLAGKTGTRLKVSYREVGANKTATKIEVVEQQQQAPAPAPAPR